MFVPRKIIEKKLEAILAEDIGHGDITAAIVPSQFTEAKVIAKEDGVVAGIEEAVIISEYMGLIVKAKAEDGEKIQNKQVLMHISGDAQTILAVERTLLNLLSRMSGIATQTRKLTDALKKSKTNTRISATRKTAPGLNFFDKKAAAIGGGDPHRFHLDDMVLIKDNHLALLGNIEEAIMKAKRAVSFSKKIEVEVTCLEDAFSAAKAGADVIMLDNFSPRKAKEAASELRKAGFDKVLIEISGGVTEDNLVEYATSNVDVISMGSLTHSVKALDISLEIVSEGA